MVTGHGRIKQALRVWLPVGFFLVVALFPFYWMAITSIKPNSELYNKNVMPLIVHAPTLKHYVDLLTKSSFLLWTWNTMLVAVVATAISLVLGTMLAYPLARMRFAGASLIAMTIAATAQANKPIQLAEDGQANPEESLRIRKALGELPVVEIKSLGDTPKRIAFVAHAALVGWISEKEVLLVEDHILVGYNVATGARRKSTVKVEDALHVFLR